MARESASFYNALFLDHDDGGIYFNVLANGLPFVLGTERFKGSHSMRGYHSFELCLSGLRLHQSSDHRGANGFLFRPYPGGFKDNMLRVSPDILPKGSVRIGEVWIDEQPYGEFDPAGLTVKLPENHGAIKVRVHPRFRLKPAFLPIARYHRRPLAHRTGRSSRRHWHPSARCSSRKRDGQGRHRGDL